MSSFVARVFRSFLEFDSSFFCRCLVHGGSCNVVVGVVVVVVVAIIAAIVVRC